LNVWRRRRLWNGNIFRRWSRLRRRQHGFHHLRWLRR
jgi:hypothetical protein